MDWSRGGVTGSLNKWVRREIRDHMRENVAIKRSCHGIELRALKWAFEGRTFGTFIGIYVLVAIAGLIATQFCPEGVSAWTHSREDIDSQSLLTSITGNLITTQVGVLGVISIAIGLVTLIAQRQGAETNVKLYYRGSMAFEVVASSIALLVVLSVQLVWPLAPGTSFERFKFVLLGAHMTWLLVNLCALAYFVSTTFRFVQQTAREDLRERYTANVVIPAEMTNRLREQVYQAAGSSLMEKVAEEDHLVVHFGLDLGEPYQIELEKTFGAQTALYDVRMTWVRWAAQRWWARCQKSPTLNFRPRGISYGQPQLWFTPHLDIPLHNKKLAWCRRRGGVPLDRIERLALRWAFRFARTASAGDFPTPEQILEELADRWRPR